MKLLDLILVRLNLASTVLCIRVSVFYLFCVCLVTFCLVFLYPVSLVGRLLGYT